MYVKCLDCKNVFEIFPTNYQNLAIKCLICGSSTVAVSNKPEYLKHL